MGTMGVKTGIKTFSTAPQNEIQKPDLNQTMSAKDRQRFNDEAIGNVLNKISDPNYVDPSKKMRTVGNDKLDKDAFMKLMLAQMKNQDPTNPLKSHEMAAQLAQFGSVEQMMNMNQTLTEIKNSQKPTESFQALNFIGKSVSGDSSKVIRMKGDKEHDLNYQLSEDTQSVSIKVKNGEGEMVRDIQLENIKKGANSWTWNGQNESGNVSPPGEYSIIIEAIGKNGKKLSAKTDFDGVISGVNFTAEGPVLLVGNQAIKIKDVKKITEPELLNGNQENLKTKSNQDLKSKADPRENVNMPPDNILKNVSLSRGMMEQLKKERK